MLIPRMARWCAMVAALIVVSLTYPQVAHADTTFTKTSAPRITGNVEVGETLTADEGEWVPTPSAFSYQWYADDTAIAGATSSTYVLTQADLGAQIKVDVTGSLAGYASVKRTSAKTNQALAMYAMAPAPSIGGSLVKGSVVTADTGIWTPTPDSYRYQWLMDQVPIPGANAGSLTLDSSFVGHTVQVAVSAQKGSYGSLSTYSAVSSKVLDAFDTVGTPTLTGDVQVGGTMSVDTGSWSPADNVSFDYQWYAGDSAIAAATGASVTLPATTLGKPVSVAVTASKDGFASRTVSSARTKAVAAGSWSITRAVTVTGSTAIGGKLTAVGPGTSLTAERTSYQWYFGSKAIAGATRSTFTTTTAQIGKQVSVQVTVSKVGYRDLTSATVTSHPVGTFWRSYAPTLSGSVTAGHTARATVPTGWQPSVSHWSYQWYVDGAKVRGATRSTYAVPASKRGHRISVHVIGARAGYVSMERFSSSARIS